MSRDHNSRGEAGDADAATKGLSDSRPKSSLAAVGAPHPKKAERVGRPVKHSVYRTLVVLGFAAYAVFLGMHFVSAAGGSDSSGYLNSAKLLLSGRVTTHYRPIPELDLSSRFNVLPLGFIFDPNDDSTRIVPTYPTGMPLQYAATGLVFGLRGGTYIVGLAGALAAVWLCYRCARELGISRTLAWAGALALAVSPVFLFIAVQPMSDGLATTWCLAAAYGALRTRDCPRWAVFCGIATGMAVLVRPTNVLVIPALLVLIGQWRPIVLMFLGGVPAMLWLGAYQHALYGSAWRSGYGDVGAVFRSSNLAPTLRHYGEWLPRLLPWPFLVLPLAACMHWAERRRIVVGLMLLWALPVLIFYAFYDVTRETWWYTRFILPAFPPIILLATLGLQAVFDRILDAGRMKWRAAIAGLLIAWTALLAYHSSAKVGALEVATVDPVFEEVTTWAGRNLPANAVVTCMIASGSLFYYTDLPLLRWDTIAPEEWRRHVAALENARRPLYALHYTPDEESDFRKHVGGNWTKVVKIHHASIWRWNKTP